MAYKKLWSDMHSNIHHDQMLELDQWISHAKEVCDFWPIAYYPFHMKKSPAGAGLEDIHDEKEIKEDWEELRRAVIKVNGEGFPMFMGYEWQGSGLDGDHNVFFLDNDQDMKHPMRYEQLRDQVRGTEAIAIPHHVAYQLGSRGKNWETHDEDFSPFAEIYSSHGCSERDTGPFDMERHLHMGPRTGETCYERGLEKGYRVGAIASGDNHNIPAVYDHGTMCVLTEEKTREAIWDGLRKSRVYGVSRSRMDIDFTINGQPMGSIVEPGEGELNIHITAADAIDRVELLNDNVLERMLVHSGTWERTAHDGKFLAKFAVEFGWGPNPRFYSNMLMRKWHGALTVPGKLCSIEKCWNSYGQRLYDVTDQSCSFDMTTYMSTTTGHWMGPSAVVKEGFVFEVEGTMEDTIRLEVNGHIYDLPMSDLMHSSRIIAEYQESVDLAARVFGDADHYRDDFYWHNAYKIRLRQAVPEAAYTLTHQSRLQLSTGSQYRLRVWLKNGDTAWTSPIYVN